MTPEPTDALVERVRETLGRAVAQAEAVLKGEVGPEWHADWVQEWATALTELAERVKAAERERDLLALAASGAEAQRDELVEALEQCAAEIDREEYDGAQLLIRRDIARAALAKVRSEESPPPRDSGITESGKRLADEEKPAAPPTNPSYRLDRRGRVLPPDEDDFLPIGHPTC